MKEFTKKDFDKYKENNYIESGQLMGYSTSKGEIVLRGFNEGGLVFDNATSARTAASMLINLADDLEADKC